MSIFKFRGFRRQKGKHNSSNPSGKPAKTNQTRQGGGKQRFLDVYPGDIFDNERYVVRKQLGAGRYSTVWLAQDNQLKKPVALKILSSDLYNGGTPLFEVDIMRRIRDVSATSHHPGKNHVMEFIDDFEHYGPSGRHVCLVFACLGPSLHVQMTKAKCRRLPCATAKRVTQQLLEAIDFLQTECGILHTDIISTNILLDDRNGVAETESRSDPSSVLDDEVQIRLCDFGLACWTDEHLTDRIQPFVLRAPEITLGAPWEASVDVYDIGCLSYFFVTGDPPFSDGNSGGENPQVEGERLELQTRLFGPMPKVLLDNASRKSDFYNDCGQLRLVSSAQHSDIKQDIELKAQAYPELKDDLISNQITIFCDFLHSTLATDPRMRKVPRDLASHPWVKRSGTHQAG